MPYPGMRAHGNIAPCILDVMRLMWLGEAVASWRESFHESEPLDDLRVGIFPSQLGCVWHGRELAAALPFLPWPRGGKPSAFSCLPSPGTSPEALGAFLGGGLGTNSN